MHKVAILGTGSWGTALAFHLAHTGHDVSLWGRNAELVSEVKARRANAVYLPEVVLPPAVVPTASLEEALQKADIVVAAVPSHGTRAVIRSASPYIPRQALIVSATKGLEQDTLLRISEVIAQEVRGARPIAVLSGPSFAMEVARGLPTAVCVACIDPVLAEDVQREQQRQSRRDVGPRHSPDSPMHSGETISARFSFQPARADGRWLFGLAHWFARRAQGSGPV